jgi:hypothetical protein
VAFIRDDVAIIASTNPSIILLVMAFEVFPQENELLSFFEVEPEIFGDTVLTYKRQYASETLFCSFSPDYGDLDLTLLQQDKQKLVLSLSYIQNVEVVKDTNREYLKVTFQPSKCMRDFILVVKPEVFIHWGTDLDKD